MCCCLHVQIESERSSDGVPIDSRTSQPPSCVVFVQKAQRLGEVDSDVEEKLKQAAEIVRGRGRNRDVEESGVSSVVKTPDS